MARGLALIGHTREHAYEGERPIKLKDCLKCSTCGHSKVLAGANEYFKIPMEPKQVGYA
jgi:hypothetical protein